MSWRLVGPTFIALAIIVSTIVAQLVPASVPFVLAGPILMAGSLLAVAWVDHRRFAGPQAIVGGALILGAAVVLAGALSARRDPASVAQNMWLYGTAVGASMSLTLGRGCRRDPPQ